MATTSTSDSNKSSSNVKVLWAERPDQLFITLEATDADEALTKVIFAAAEDTIIVEGVYKNAPSTSTSSSPLSSSSASASFRTTLKLYGKIADPERDSLAQRHTYRVLGKEIQLVAHKATAGKQWGRLTREPPKTVKTWLGCDWRWWQDEDDSEDDAKTIPDAFGQGRYGDTMSHMLNSSSGGSGGVTDIGHVSSTGSSSTAEAGGSKTDSTSSTAASAAAAESSSAEEAAAVAAAAAVTGENNHTEKNKMSDEDYRWENNRKNILRPEEVEPQYPTPDDRSTSDCGGQGPRLASLADLDEY